MKILKQIIYLVLLIIITLFCVFNKASVDVSIPFYDQFNVPLYFVIIFSCIVGVIIGSLNSYLKSVKQSISFRKIEDSNAELSHKIHLYEADEKLRDEARRAI